MVQDKVKFLSLFLFQMEHVLVTRARQVWTHVLMIMLVVMGQYVNAYLGLRLMELFAVILHVSLVYTEFILVRL